MDLTLEINALREVITAANKIVILLPDSASKDMVAGALALYLSLEKLQKEISIIYAKDPIVDWANLVGVNKLVKNLGNKNFVISLDYIEGSIEKVSYNIEGNKFNLVIEPKNNAPVFDEKKIHYHYSGFAADLLITVGVSALNNLGSHYTDNASLFAEKPVVAISNLPNIPGFGKVNFMLPAASVSEIIAQIVKNTELPMDADIATNLYLGIVHASRNFSSHKVTADTLEAAAWCLRLGARKYLPTATNEEKPAQEFSVATFPDRGKAPPDWLKPKIFKGSQLL